MKFYPKVSIIIPVYNGENYIKEAIDSAISQTYKNIEIIVVNDGSVDRTEEIVKKYGKKIKYIKKENGGTSTALNLGIKNMTGEYFSWLSHDDMYYKNKIERQVKELELLDNKNTIIMSDLDGINEEYKKIYETKYLNHIKAYPKRKNSNIHPIIYNQTHGCTLLISKICFDTVGLFDDEELVAQDFEFFYRAFLKFPHKLIPEVLVTARDSSNRQGIRSKAKGNIEYSRLFIKIIENLSEKDYDLLAPSKLSFYRDMEEFFEAAGYTIALEYIRRKMLKNLQISSYDLVGRRFNGHDLHLFLRENDIDSQQLVLYKQSNDENTFNYNFFEKNATKDLLTKKKITDSKLLHFHLIHNIFDINYLPILSNMIPSVITLHDCFFLSGHCVHHFDCKKWQSQCMDCPYLDALFPIEKDISTLNFMLKYNAIKNSQISLIVSSKWMMKKVQKSTIWKDKKLYYLPFGIDTNKFKPATNNKIRKQFGINEDSFVIFFRAENDKFKGIEIIKEAMNYLCDLKDVTLITVGTKGLLKEYENRINIIDLGWVQEEETIIKLYQSCDIFLMPSKQETFGLMALEAMSCGKTVFALDDAGSALSDIINAPHCGVVAKKSDFSKKLLKLISNKEDLIKRGIDSREYVLKNHDKKDYIKNMIKIYEETINNHKTDELHKELLSQLKTYGDNSGISKNANDAQFSSSDNTFIDSNQSFNDTNACYSNKKNISYFFRKNFRKYLPLNFREKLKKIIRPIYYKIRK